ncbi:MAG: amidohydrolase family protein [Planctomycetaceae bacterium]|nr:amidohydrolase family protein [Planctomycetaceae bacterium]
MQRRNSQMTRRELLVSGVGVGAAVGLGVLPSTGAAEGDDAGWIDAHSHIWGRDVAEFPLANGNTLDDLSPQSFTTEELFAVCEPVGVKRVVLIQHHIYHGWDNSYLVHEAARFPQRLRVVGMVDDRGKSPGLAMRSLLKQHVTGFRITSRIQGREQWLSGDGMREMWQTAAETGQAMCCLIDPADLVGVDAMCAQHPATKVVIDHFARIGADGEIRSKDVDQLCRLARHPAMYVKISAYYALGKKQPPYHDLVPMIRRLLDAFGPERLMWASDAPYQLDGEHTYAASLALIRDHLSDLSDGDRNWLLRKTAAGVYFFQ